MQREHGHCYSVPPTSSLGMWLQGEENVAIHWNYGVLLSFVPREVVGPALESVLPPALSRTQPRRGCSSKQQRELSPSGAQVEPCRPQLEAGSAMWPIQLFVGLSITAFVVSGTEKAAVGAPAPCLCPGNTPVSQLGHRNRPCFGLSHTELRRGGELLWCVNLLLFCALLLSISFCSFAFPIPLLFVFSKLLSHPTVSAFVPLSLKAGERGKWSSLFGI